MNLEQLGRAMAAALRAKTLAVPGGEVTQIDGLEVYLSHLPDPGENFAFVATEPEDPDAALAASKRLGANFVLRGLISSQATRNPMMAVNQVSVNMGFTLTGSNGRVISNVDANSSSYAGADVQHMALTLVNEKADEVVAELYSDYCRSAGLTAGNKPAPK